MDAEVVFIYDKSFDGFLTAIFTSYRFRLIPAALAGLSDTPGGFWSRQTCIETNPDQADRVWDGLTRKINRHNANRLFRLHLSGIEGADIVLFHTIRKIFDQSPSLLYDLADPDVSELVRLEKKVNREVCRAMQFTRFQQTADGIYFAACNPEYNVVPMVLRHFRDRFADQRWMIYDLRRKAGYYFDGNGIQMVTMTTKHFNGRSGEPDPSVLSVDELGFQKLWKQYFRSICIKERMNSRLHMQMMPKKYWPYLIEKKPDR